MPIWKQALLRTLNKPEGHNPTSGGGDTNPNPAPTPPAPTPPAPTPPAPTPPNTDPAPNPAPTAPTVSDAEAKLLKENMQKKEKLEKLTKELDDAKILLNQLNELGGLDQIKTLVAEQKDAETKKLEAKGEWDRLKQRMADEHAKREADFKKVISETKDELKSAVTQINELTIGAAFASSQFIANDLLLTPAKTRVVYGDHFDLVEGKVVGFDKPRGAASRTPLVDSAGNPVAFDAALAKIIEADPEKDSMLRSKVKPGAGSTTKKGEPTPQPKELGSMDKIASGLKGLKIEL